mgnify:CR=1 FL=1
MNISLKFRDQYIGDLYIVGEELDQLVAAINARVPVSATGNMTFTGGTVVDTNNDKTGYSLTAGSYSVRASSTQFIAVAIANGAQTVTGSHSSVTTTRTQISHDGSRVSSSDLAGGIITRLVTFAATTLDADRSSAAAGSNGHGVTYGLLELF